MRRWLSTMRGLAALAGCLAALGCIKINLQVLETNSAVVRFYQEAGYEIEPRVSMSKRRRPKI